MIATKPNNTNVNAEPKALGEERGLNAARDTIGRIARPARMLQ